MNEWECVQVNNHNEIGKVIREWKQKGWRLHTYQATRGRTSDVRHYLLFEKGE